MRTNIMSKVAAESATREYMQLARVTHNISTNDDWEYFVDQHVCTTSIRDDDDADASAVLAHWVCIRTRRNKLYRLYRQCCIGYFLFGIKQKKELLYRNG